MLLILTCYEDQMNNRKALDLATGCPAGGASTGWAPTVAALYFWEEWVERSEDDIPPSPKRMLDSFENSQKVPSFIFENFL